VQHQLADHRLDLGRLGRAERLDHEQRDAKEELAFGEVLGRALVGGMGRVIGAWSEVVEEPHVAEQEDALPRHQHVVEEDDAVHLLEAGAERVVEMGTAEIVAVAAKEAQALGGAGNGEGEREGAVRAGVEAEARRIDRDLVGVGTEGREDAGAPDDDAGARLADDVERGAFLEIIEAGARPAALQIDEGVGEDEIVLADVLVVAAHILAELGAAAREVAGGGGPSSE
jgi:hypothetical protein